MTTYSEPVAAIVEDYLDRLKRALRLAPEPEQSDLLKEVRSHIFEAYHAGSGPDEVPRILAVLRNLGEPADVVADRLPGALARTGTRRGLPMHLAGGLLIALFGIPLGIGGAAAITGLFAALSGFVLAYYAATGAVLLTGSLALLLGLARTHRPDIWERLLTMGVIRIDGNFAEFIEPMTASEQGFLLVLFGGVFVVAGIGLLWLGQYLLRGARFLFLLAFDRLRAVIRRVKAKAQSRPRPAGHFAAPGPDGLSHARPVV